LTSVHSDDDICNKFDKVFFTCWGLGGESIQGRVEENSDVLLGMVEVEVEDVDEDKEEEEEEEDEEEVEDKDNDEDDDDDDEETTIPSDSK